MKCLRCSKQHKVLDMVMDVSGRGMVCRQCAGLAPKPGAKLVRAENAPMERERYTCAECNFKFSSSKGKQATCGYCGSPRVVPERQNSAGNILKEASMKRYEI